MSFADLNIVCDEQGTKEWFEARVGMLTSSRIKDAVSKRKRNPAEELACRIDLRLDLTGERLTGKPAEHFVSRWMEEGREKEPLARAAYEVRKDLRTKQVGFVLHPDRRTLQWAGCSPDGLIGDSGLVEFKCPKVNTHIGYLLGECVPEEYIPQMMWQMACCPGYEWNDFVSYHPDFPEPHDLFICRLSREDARIKGMEIEARKFLEEVEGMVGHLTGGLEYLLRKSLGAANPTAQGIPLRNQRADAAPEEEQETLGRA